MEKIVFLVEKLSTEETTLSSTMIDALALSDNFTSNYQAISFQSHELEVANLEHDSEDIYIECPYCKHCEQQPIDQQRHHLQTIQLSEWLKDKEGIERSLMKCLDCEEEFIQLWDYMEEEELEEIEWNYSCSTSTLWGSFDFGMVLAKTKEEAKEKATKELEARVIRMNKLLGEEYTIGINLDNLEITRND